MIEIIPAIDVIEGKCVRLSQGDYDTKKIYNESPVDVAKMFEDAGIQRLHIVDLDGAKQSRIVNIKTLEAVANATKLKIDFGGGIKTTNDVQTVLNAGATFFNIGSIAVKQPAIVEGWIKRFGASKILLGADVKDENIMIHGWQQSANINIFNYISAYIIKGINNIFCTDISKDGLLQGASVDLYKKILAEFSELNLIASGGVTVIEDVDELNTIGCSGAIIGKALYEGRIQLSQLKKYLQ
ncbi:1-(5-phosphoribosyl)-5-[(5-phosphoribosylamino)methylideneamino]imidazole-4-carboxamide isomerase [Parafilimonas terrae]|uniref:1-(5-phosphoribosyl)-5-[(5-phosphoribosylamino)methylideneamino] imidazole-4-carboxamide isomerase n=1 Tax=Parafilimonas terrae TaxID=1465490 RepID=A0A1I5SJB9_9BACT|nr:1-(5-phosphoribosyl)-5-[(5-phosphoribosylamino)methylideneamino]imidazole-4-carboxamide isomerase [Parafilimonas terrae]SFP70835.1 1-(5-phosphoribosyl)-5-[(5-phosphoribosylamino)methylideneamino] imidazole-4-carboxamide isomerase [Parafilimonas terrae]